MPSVSRNKVTRCFRYHSPRLTKIPLDIVGVSSASGDVLLLAILAKHIQTRRKLNRWIVRSPLPGTPNEEGGEDGWDLNRGDNNTYDRWLSVRLAVALLSTGVLQLLTILNQVVGNNHIKKQFLPPEPDLSAARARGDFVRFIPGCTAGLIVS